MTTTAADPNMCLLQGFEWNAPADQKHWRRLKNSLQQLKDVGIDSIWLPPACKAAEGPRASGYDIYDLWDLGEFDQKGSKSTRWGPKEDLDELSNEANELEIGLIFDAVINHKTGADEKEECRLQAVDPHDRMVDIGEPWDTEAWLGWHFPGRGEKYSGHKWHKEHFSGTDHDAVTEKVGVYRMHNKSWSNSVGPQHGNADFLVFANIDFSHPEAVEDVTEWGIWIVRELKLKGIRIDACKHISQRFTNQWVAAIDKEFQESPILYIGDYWTWEVDTILSYLDRASFKCSIYDTPLMYNMARLSVREDADLRKVFDSTLIQVRPESAITFVASHDSQPGQACETKMEGWFKPLGYSLILLRKDGYPCVFYGDLYGLQEGSKGEKAEPPSCGGQLADIILARKLYAHGPQHDYWNDANCIGFVRDGTENHPYGLACVMSNGSSKKIEMKVGIAHRDEIWTDILNWWREDVRIRDDGMGVFACHGSSVSIWVNKDASGRQNFGQFDSNIYAKC